jgi:hypothetical protein
MMRKIAEFDQRWTVRHVKEDVVSAREEPEDEDASTDKLKPKTGGKPRRVALDQAGLSIKAHFVNFRKTQSGVNDSMPDHPGEFEVDSSDDEDKMHEMEYKVERQSSSQADHHAVKLKDDKGSWYTAAGKVKNESVVFELVEGPGTVCQIEFAIAETVATPRRCRVQYSSNNVVGPWHDAWHFTVDKPGGRTHFTATHDYGEHAKQFSSAMLRYFGSQVQASQALHTTADTVTLEELMAFYKRIQQQLIREGGGSGPNATDLAAILAVDPRFLFRDCDLKNTGKVEVKVLVAEEPPRPMSDYWRLLILDNWGSTSTIAIGGPLKLLSTERQDARRARAASLLPENSRASAMVIQEDSPLPLQPNPESKLIRRSALLHQMSPQDVQEVLDEFKRVDTDNSGCISQEEFMGLVVTLFGVEDASQLPDSRKESLWTMARKPGRNDIDFEAFLHFYVTTTRKVLPRNGETQRASLIDRIDPALMLLGEALQRRKSSRRSRAVRQSNGPATLTFPGRQSTDQSNRSSVGTSVGSEVSPPRRPTIVEEARSEVSTPRRPTIVEEASPFVAAPRPAGSPNVATGRASQEVKPIG